MQLWVLLLVSPAICAQRYQKSKDPNDEPFLPIHPVYPYNPKLIKRGTEKEMVGQPAVELNAPKIDAKDSYSASYRNYPRGPRIPAHNSGQIQSHVPAHVNYGPNQNPGHTHPSTSPAQNYQIVPYTYPTSPFSIYNSYVSPYTVVPYATVPYSSLSYPNYYYQPPYYYPNYYPQPLLPPAVPVPAGNEQLEAAKDHSLDSEVNAKQAAILRYHRNRKLKNDTTPDMDWTANHFDGANYISASKDLDSQPSSYKATSPYNQLEPPGDGHLKSFPVPKTTYRVVSVAGQPVGPDYPLPQPYMKAQQLEQMMSQALAKLLAQNPVQPLLVPVPSIDSNQNTLLRPTEGYYVNHNVQHFVPNVQSTGERTHIVNPGKVNAVQTNIQAVQHPAPLKPSKETNQYVQKPVFRVLVEDTPYKAKSQPVQCDYESYENPVQNYDGSFGQDVAKQEQNYESESAYQSQSYVPPPYNYQYSNYGPAQQAEQHKSNLEDIPFGAKTNKG